MSSWDIKQYNSTYMQNLQHANPIFLCAPPIHIMSCFNGDAHKPPGWPAQLSLIAQSNIPSYVLIVFLFEALARFGLLVSFDLILFLDWSFRVTKGCKIGCSWKWWVGRRTSLDSKRYSCRFYHQATRDIGAQRKYFSGFKWNGDGGKLHGFCSQFCHIMGLDWYQATQWISDEEAKWPKAILSLIEAWSLYQE